MTDRLSLLVAGLVLAALLGVPEYPAKPQPPTTAAAVARCR